MPETSVPIKIFSFLICPTNEIYCLTQRLLHFKQLDGILLTSQHVPVGPLRHPEHIEKLQKLGPQLNAFINRTKA